ncbi:MAG: GNAT family N-acetyltransferase [Polyangiaceae bacterium]
MASSPALRLATRDDLPQLGRLAAKLVRYHHELDPRRFFLQEPIEPGYERWFGHEMKDPGAVIVVAEAALGGKKSEIVGYAYARLEERDWNALLDACGYLHDIYVAEEARTLGVGAALLDEVARRMWEMGAPRMVLQTATQNVPAQRLFEKHGYRRTMVEMTLELGDGEPPKRS